MAERDSWAKALAHGVAWLIFCLSRLAVFSDPAPEHSDVRYYARYVQVYQWTKSAGGTFYEQHVRFVQKQKEGAFRSPTGLVSDEYQMVAYPPLAVGLTLLPSLFVPESAADGSLPPEQFADYRLAFRFLMYLFTWGCLG